jgi:spoIIIJ-associated protein
LIIKEAIGVGATVTEAQEDAINKLGANIEEDVNFEILAEAKKKVLGLFGGSEAKVRAYVEGPDEVKPRKDRNAKHGKKPAPAKTPSPAVKETVKDQTKEPAAVGVPAESVDENSPAGKAFKYISGILAKLDCDVNGATISEIEGGSKITLLGNDKLGVIIGRRGETLDALQYLASLVANENGGGYYRIVIDIGNYRERRESTLESLAKRTAGQVLRTGHTRSLEPMNPYERRIIHTAVQSIEGVYSTSVGDGASRRVVICPDGKSPRPMSGRGGRDNRQGRARQGFSGKAARTTDSPAPDSIESEKPKQVDGTKLYGKLGK